jgi:hypothetical protein
MIKHLKQETAMKKIVLTSVILLFAAACASKKTNETSTKVPSTAATTAVASDDTKAKDKSSCMDKMCKMHNKKIKKETKPATSSADATTTASPSVKCTHGKDERLLEIKAKGAGCELVYTKAGDAKAVASAANSDQHCKEVSIKMQKHLSDAGFNCL